MEQAHYGAPVSLVCGSPGSGKSTLAEEFRASFSDEALCVHVQASLFMNQGQFLDALLEQLPFGASSPEIEDIVQDLCKFAERLYLNAKTLILIVDDAHELASDVLQIIDSLTSSVTEGAAHVLILGEKELVPMFGDALGERALGRVIEEYLNPFSADDARDYVRLKLADAGCDEEVPMELAEFDRIVSESKGAPGAINIRVARALGKVLEKEVPAGKLQKDSRSIMEIGAPYWATAAGLIVLLLLVITLFQLADDQVEIAAESTQESGTTRIQLPLSVNGAQAGNVASGSVNDSISNRAVESETVPEPVSIREPEPSPEVIPDPADETIVALPDVVESAELAEGVALSESLVSAPAVAERDTASEDDVHPLMQYPPENFTIQIMGSRSEDNVQRFILQQLAAFNATYFETVHQDRPWFVVVTGNFVSRDVASRALSDLPAAVRRMDPFIRQVADVQAALR